MSNYGYIKMVYTGKEVLEQYNKGYTIVLFTSKETLLLKLNVSCSDTLNEILNNGLYRHNQVTHGRILRC